MRSHALVRQTKTRPPSLLGMMGVVAAFLLATLPPSPAWSTADEQEAVPSYVLDEVKVAGTRVASPGDLVSTIATRLPIPTQLTPASVAIVSQPLLEAQGSRVLGDALQNVSGVNVQTGFGVFDFFTIRGFDSLTSGLVLSDGVPEPEVTFYDLYNVERVEVLKGPAAFLYGGNPLSGAVNLQRKQPTSKPLLRVSAGAGRFQTMRAAVDAGGPVGSTDLAYRLNAQWRDADNFRDDKGSGSFSVNPVIRWQLAEGHQLTGQIEYVTSDYKTDAGLPVLGGVLADVPRTRSYQSPFDLSDQQIVRLKINYVKRLNERMVLRDRFYFTHLDWKSNGTLLTGPAFDQEGAPVPGQLGRTLTLLDDDQKLLGNQLELVLDADTRGLRHQLLLGLEIGRLVDDYALDIALLPGIDLLAPQESAMQPLFVILNKAGEGRGLTRALYLVDSVSLADRFQLLLGGRSDAIDYEDEANGIDQNFDKFSPMVGLVHAVDRDLSLYASAGRGFAPPSSLGRGDRRVEESEQLEVGAKKKWRDRAAATVAVYRLDKDVTSDDGVTARRGSQQAHGVEAEVWLATTRWEGVGSWAYSSGELKGFVEELRQPLADGTLFQQAFDRTGNKPAFAPRHLANVWVSRHFAASGTEGASAGFGVRYVSEQFSAEDNAYEIDGVMLVDATASWKRGAANLRLRLANLTNRKYETRGFGSASAIPADPFSVSVSVDWNW